MSPREKTEITEIADPHENQAQEHDRIAGRVDDDAHDHRPQAQSQIRDCRERSHRRTDRRADTIKRIGHQGGREKGIPHPPDRSN